jgi:hypothetical protein
MKTIGKRAELPLPVHCHMLRHSCGYKLANDGHDTRANWRRRPFCGPQELRLKHRADDQDAIGGCCELAGPRSSSQRARFSTSYGASERVGKSVRARRTRKNPPLFFPDHLA